MKVKNNKREIFDTIQKRKLEGLYKGEEGGGSQPSSAISYYYVNSGRDTDGPYTDTPIHFSSTGGSDMYLIDATGSESTVAQNLHNDVYSGKHVKLMALDDNFNSYAMEVVGYPNNLGVADGHIGFAIKYDRNGSSTNIPIMVDIK